MSLILNSGLLGQSTPTALGSAFIYTVPANVTASVALSACNKAATASLIRVSVKLGAVTSFLAYDEPLPPAGQQGNQFQMRAIVLQAGAQLQVYSSTGNIDFVASGYEEPANFTSLDA